MNDQAMRFNVGKPPLSYLLSFSGGIDLLSVSAEFLPPLRLLSAWYRGESQSLFEALAGLISCLDSCWPELLAEVSAAGAAKYARGNYLKGRPWSDTCDSLLRHLIALSCGETHDLETHVMHDGHIAWNLLYLQHCVLTMPRFDDRLRAPTEVPNV